MPNTTCWRDGCGEPKTKWGMCSDHYQQWIIDYPPITTRLHGLPESNRFWAYVERQDVEKCWIWRRALDLNGYAVFNLDEASGGGQEKGHRYAYRQLRGEIPLEIDGQAVELDHECRIRPCCNPWHLEAVSQTVNTMRGISFSVANANKTHCDHDHEFTPKNTYRGPDGSRRCRICMAGQNRAWRERNGLSVPSGPYGASQEEHLAQRREKAIPKTGVRGKGAYQRIRDRCPEGHLYEGDNLILERRKRKDGTYREVRRCRTCVNTKARENHGKRTR